MPISNFFISRRSSFPDRIVAMGGQERAMWSRVYYGATFPAGPEPLTSLIRHGMWSVVPERMLDSDWDDAGAILGIDLREAAANRLREQTAYRVELAASARASRRLARDIPDPLPLPG